MGVSEKVKTSLKGPNYHVLNNSKIKEKHLAKYGLHLNSQVYAILAINLLSGNRNQE